MNQLPKLPSCEYRVDLEDANSFGCRHQRLFAPGHRVTASICLTCKLRSSVCEEPRSIDEVKNPKKVPSLAKRGWNLTKALTTFVSDGCQTLREEDYQTRLQICDTCARRREDHCLECGCRLSLKARGRAFRCPLGKWPTETQVNIKEEQ